MIYYVIPNLIKQPTWGGDYIAKAKGLEKKLGDEKIGQSYEFYSESEVIEASKLESVKQIDLPYYIATNKEKDKKLVNPRRFKPTPVNKLELRKVFGVSRVPELLLKLTQAQGNSYQLHPKIKGKKYQPKAESWFFLQRGKVTLGIRPDADIEQYRNAVESIYAKTKEISKEVKKKKKTIEMARAELQNYIDSVNPEQYVNVMPIEKGAVIDNHMGGIHHSWEEDYDMNPEGNIVYEVQQDVMDDKSTIRAYDKGKLLDDGGYRELDIPAYFENLDTSESFNNPTRWKKKPIILKETKNYSLRKMFDNPYYQMDVLEVDRVYDVEELGFRHMYIKSGKGHIKTEDEKISLIPGHSYIIPSSTKKVKIKNENKKEDPMVILVTYDKIRFKEKLSEI